MVNKLWRALIDDLFPQYCLLCDRASERELPLCRPCAADLQRNTRHCARGALPLPPTPDGPARLCGTCLQHPPPFTRVVAPWLYCERLAHLIQRWKFNGEERLTPLLAELWLQQAGSVTPVDMLVPVPLHWRRKWRRGYNQSELLCRQLRARHPALQRGAFTAQLPCANLRLAIVDDVLTTGATASALARALAAAGADTIEVWCLARTPAPGR